MSLTKRHLEDVQAEEEMREWIREQGDMFMVEGDEEWEELKNRYLNGDISSNLISVFDEWDDDYFDAELHWTKEQKAFSTFIILIDEIRKNLAITSSSTTLKMNYSFSVTIMESCLGDMLRGVIFSHGHYMSNAIKNVNELKSIKVSLLDAYEQVDLVNKIVLKTLAEKYTYHNINTIISVYSNVICEPLSDSIKRKIEEMLKIVDVRHDIVHRNGFTTEGTEHDLTYEKVNHAIDIIVNFVSEIKDYIDATEAKRVFGQINNQYTEKPF